MKWWSTGKRIHHSHLLHRDHVRDLLEEWFYRGIFQRSYPPTFVFVVWVCADVRVMRCVIVPWQDFRAGDESAWVFLDRFPDKFCDDDPMTCRNRFDPVPTYRGEWTDWGPSRPRYGIRDS